MTFADQPLHFVHTSALSFALGAGPAFRLKEASLATAIDRYGDEEGQIQLDPRPQAILENVFKKGIESGEYEQILDTRFKLLSYRTEVLHFLFPLFPLPTSHSSHIHTIIRLLVSLSDVPVTVGLFSAWIPKERLLAFLKGRTQDFLQGLRETLPAGERADADVHGKLREILSGEESIKLYLQFLQRNNKFDLPILRNSEDSLNPRSSVYHTALSLQNAFMQLGTAPDAFLRQNLERLAIASNWSKFSATAALGVIHKGNLDHGMELFGPYSPGAEGAGAAGGPYSEGGTLYALGLVNAGHGSGRVMETYLIEKLKAANQDPVQHGASLGLGVADMGAGKTEAYDALKETLYTDSAVGGGAAGLAMEEADEVVKDILADKEPIIHYGGVYTLAFAYAGSANNSAIRNCCTLHESYNPHVGYVRFEWSSIMCTDSLDPLDFVRQGALTALGIVLVQPSEASSPSLASHKHEDPIARFGASLGQASSTLGLQSRSGTKSVKAIVGMVLFCQFWYWYPLAHLCAPKFDFVSNARPSLFAYPQPTKPSTKETVEKVLTAVLSTAAKAEVREKIKKREAEGDLMETEEKADARKSSKVSASKADKFKESKESSGNIFSRVTPSQLLQVPFPTDRLLRQKSQVPTNPACAGIFQPIPRSSGKQMPEQS
ncbi:hypothetical protein SISNIDRAFT_526918 [Sistotremastrum niveocremeum HHB9708]|uniref:Uncharacterized protein n=1 Tax=Sistotremastrum niveocremeum HHB9708 TaxID=1314777 RepID=A0A164QD40_9AGAM|nr:hypothetical protein SISNIDRAFT_526918 [Sistotremastrum niveocremeum HHB9708]